MMNRIHRRTFLSLPIIALLGTSGCATKALMEQANKSEYRQYEETVSQVLVTADGKKLAVLSSTYHYIFDAPEGFAELLDSRIHQKLSAKFGLFQVNASGDVEGLLTLVLSNPSDDERIASSAFGFTGSSTTIRRAIQMRGKRYSAGDFSMPASLKSLNQSYNVQVREELPKGGRQALVLMTPLTMAVDGVLVLFAIPLVPVIFIMLSTKNIGF